MAIVGHRGFLQSLTIWGLATRIEKDPIFASAGSPDKPPESPLVKPAEVMKIFDFPHTTDSDTTQNTPSVSLLSAPIHLASRQPSPSATEDLGDVSITVLRLGEETSLPKEFIQRWREILAGNPNLRSPYFTPGFTLAAARSRPDTELVVVSRRGRIVVLMPFHRIGAGRGIPVGGAINDYHGVVAEDAGDVDLPAILDAARLKTFRFHSWFWPQTPWVHQHVVTTLIETSATIASATGSETRSPSGSQPAGAAAPVAVRGDYFGWMEKHSTTIRRQGQKTRKMERELGPLRFEFHDPDPKTLDWVIGLKREKYQRTGCTDFFAPQWSRDLLHQLHGNPALDRDHPTGLRSVLSVLYAGPHRVAGHFGIAAGSVLHYWYPVFDRQWNQFSPGTELYLQIAGAARGNGFDSIEMGYGQEPFKLRITNRTGQLLSGCFGATPLQLSLERFLSQTKSRVQKSRFRSLIRSAVRSVWPSAGKPVVK